MNNPNKGITRNKKPLQNIIYSVRISEQLKYPYPNEAHYDRYKFKDLGWLALDWWYEGQNSLKSTIGFITPENLKAKLGETQWGKFCQGKREFIIQRRIDGKNT